MRRPPPAAAETAAPLALGEFAALLDALGPFEPAPHLAVAVSGGPDSMALALLTAAWARARGGRVLGLVVDHGLRRESAGEAELAAGWLEGRGIRARVLAWRGEKPATAIQATARVARMCLLLDACRADGVLHLLLAHQREDQAETVALRRAAGSAAAGMAGMAAVREVPGLRLLRPLLAVPKERLAATLAAAGQPWLVDPANRAARFARARLRADPAFEPEGPWARGAAQAVARRAEDERLAAWLVRVARPNPLGFVGLDAALWAELEPTLRAALLARLLATVGGRAYPVAAGKVGRIAETAGGAPATLGGCTIVRRRGAILVCREPARIRHRLTLAPGAVGQWDGRFAVRHESGPGPVEVKPLGPAGLQTLGEAARKRLRRAGVPATVWHGVPAAWAGADLAACPALAPYGLHGRAGYSITTVLRPTLPLAAAPFTGVNVVSNPQEPI